MSDWVRAVFLDKGALEQRYECSKCAIASVRKKVLQVSRRASTKALGHSRRVAPATRVAKRPL